MDTVRRFFAAAPAYRERLHQYTLRDFGLAMGYYILLLVIYWGMGRLLAVRGTYLGVPASIVLALLPILLCIRRLPSVGISGSRLRPSLLVSGSLGAVFICACTVIPGIVSHAALLPFGKILYNLFYYFVIISFSEELSFRGFLQPRLSALLKREWVAVAVCGALFTFMHYPFQMALRGMTFAEYWPIFAANAPLHFLWHLIFTWLCRRYDNIWGSTVLHGFVDMSMGIFA